MPQAAFALRGLYAVGADAVAVISALFGIRAAARSSAALFEVARS